LVVWEQEVSIGAAKPAAAAFVDTHPKTKVKWVPTPMEQTATKLLAAISARSGAPDLAFIDYVNMARFTALDGAGLVDLRPYMTTGGYQLNEWFEWNLDLVTTESGKIVGLPTDLGVMATFYRRDIFEAAGLPTDPDSVFESISTWENLLETGSKLAETGHFMVGDAADVFNILRQRDVQAYFDDSGQPIVNNAAYVEAAELAQRIRNEGLDLNPANDAETGAAMKEGKVACYFSAAWFDVIIRATAPETSGAWGVTPLPEGATGNLGGSYYVIPKQSSQLEQAWDFASFVVATNEGLTPYLEGLKFLPGWRPSYGLPVFSEPDPFYADQVWLGPFTKAGADIPPIRLNGNDPVAADAVESAITDILDRGADPKQRLDQAASQIEQQSN
jgi:ABC-type glycerol-3-phosphate transport system substrate-binding protein